MHVVRALAALAIATTSAGAARAEADEWALSFGPALRVLATHVDGSGAASEAVALAPLAFVRLRYGLDDFFQLGVSLDAGVAFDADGSGDPLPSAAAVVEIHYMIDIVTWVPFVTLGVGAVVRGEERVTASGDVVSIESTITPELVATLGAGVEYRPARDWALGLSGRWEPLLTSFGDADVFSFALFYTHFFE